MNEYVLYTQMLQSNDRPKEYARSESLQKLLEIYPGDMNAWIYDENEGLVARLKWTSDGDWTVIGWETDNNYHPVHKFKYVPIHGEINRKYIPISGIRKSAKFINGEWVPDNGDPLF